MRSPVVAITVGDPAGIGPEISLKAASHPDVLAVCEPVLYGPTSESQLEGFDAGRVSAEAGQCARCDRRAVADAQAGRVDAIATAPINKEAFAAAGIPWRGHTELLAHLTGTSRFAMMFYAEELRDPRDRAHPAGRGAADLTRDRLESIVMLAADALPQLRLVARQAGGGRLESSRGRARRDWDRRRRCDPAGDRGLPGTRRRRARAVSGRHHLPAGDETGVRCRGVLPRSGADSGEDGRVRAGRQRHARAADRAHVGGSWNGVRHRAARHRGSAGA